jgi:hypothetical protein
MERERRKEKEKRKILFVAPADESNKTFDRAHDNIACTRAYFVRIVGPTLQYPT